MIYVHYTLKVNGAKPVALFVGGATHATASKMPYEEDGEWGSPTFQNWLMHSFQKGIPREKWGIKPTTMGM